MKLPELTEGQYRTLLLLACAAAMGAIAYSYWKSRESSDAEYARMVSGMIAQHAESVGKMQHMTPPPVSERDSRGRFRKVQPVAGEITLPEDTPKTVHIMRPDDFGARIAE